MGENLNMWLWALWGLDQVVELPAGFTTLVVYFCVMYIDMY